MASAVGPLPTRCETCAPLYRRRSAAEREERRKQRRRGARPEAVRCTDCKVELAWDGRGRPKLRCEDCRTARGLALSRTRYASAVATDPELARERWRQGYRRNAERIRDQKLDQHYRKRYGLTKAEVEDLREARAGLCDICNRPADARSRGARLHVDHCHTTGRIRGLLCGNCNTMIGLANEDPAVLLAAVEYLKEGAV